MPARVAVSLLILTVAGTIGFARDAQLFPKRDPDLTGLLERARRVGALARRDPFSNMPPDVQRAIQQQEEWRTCALPDSSRRYPENAIVTYGGRQFRCALFYDSSADEGMHDGRLRLRGAGWVPVDRR